MSSRLIRGIGSFVFWSYERGTWQYDLMVALILAFVFLTPRGLFTDRPRPAAGQIEQRAGDTGPIYRIDGAVLAGSARSLQLSARQVLEDTYGHRIKVHQVKPVLDGAGTVRAYDVFTEKR